MAVTAEMIDAMVAAGISPEQILVVVRSELARQHVTAAEAERARIEANREGNRLRQAAFRAQRNAHNGSNGESNGSNADNASNGVMDVKTASSQGSPSASKSAHAHKRADRHRGTRIPADFDLRPEARQACLDAGLAGRDVDEALAEFQDFWVGIPGARGMKLDWLATLRNRLRKSVRRQGRPRDAPARCGTGNGFLDALLIEGHTDREVARRLGISPTTVGAVRRQTEAQHGR